MTDTGAGTPLTAGEEDLYREGLRTAPSMIGATGHYRDLLSMTTAEWADRCRRLLATLDAARSRPATDPAGLSDYQRGYVDGFDAPANVAARSRPATNPATGYVPGMLFGTGGNELSRPATDPAGLDALRDIVDRCRQHIAGLGADLLTIKAREATSAQRDAAADRAYAHLKGIDTTLTDAIRDARLSVAGGPGPRVASRG